MRIVVPAVALLGTLSFVNSALAHIELLSPLARESEQKQGPCGRDGSVRGDIVTEVRSGSVLHVTWRESVNHPSHFRISFDVDGEDGFVDPATADDRFTNDTVLIDGISDEAGGTFSADVTLPDIECDHCTLQLIQLMYDKAPYAPGTNDLYYRCADLTLRRDTTTPPAGDPGDPAGVPGAAADGGDHGTGNTAHEQDTNAATAAPSSQPASSESASMCSAGPAARGVPAVWALFFGLLFTFSWRGRHRMRALSKLMSKARRRC